MNIFLFVVSPCISTDRWVNDTENWLIDDEDMPLLCGNLTGARHCPPGMYINMHAHIVHIW